MSRFSIPNRNNQIRHSGRSDYLELSESFAIDLNRRFGKVFTSKKLVKCLDETDDLGGSRVLAFESNDTYYYLATTSDVYRCLKTSDPTDSANWSDITAITSSLAAVSDLQNFGSLLLMTSNTSVYSWDESSDTFNSSYWSGISGSALTSGVPHQLHVHRGGVETLFVTDGNKIRYYNTPATHSTVTLQNDLIATCVTSGVQAIWVGTESESEGNAYVYEIYVGETSDNGTPIARQAYKVEGRKVMAIEVIDNIPHIITEKGNIQAFNGAGFTTVASFPFANTTEVIGLQSVGPNSMKLHNDSLYINISTERRGTLQDYAVDTPSGIWEYNRITGQMNHRFGFADTDSEYGAKELSNVNAGPVYILDNEFGFIMAANEINQSGRDSGVFADTGSRFGYYVTGEINSETVQDAYESVYLKSKTLVSGDSIELKYRKKKKDRLIVDGVYLNTTSINTTADISTVEVGDEVTDVHTGKIAHITKITGTTTKTVKLDTAIGTTGNAVRAEFLNFKPISFNEEDTTYDPTTKDTYTSEDGEVKRWGGFGTNTWIQYKVVMYGDVEQREFISEGKSKHEL